MIIPKYELIKKDIKHKINDGIILSGDKIPTQVELEKQYNVSKITVKRAISDLISERYLELLPGKKGFFAKKMESKNFSNTIAVIIDDITDRYGATLLRGIEDYLWDNKYHAIICNADRNFEKVEEYFHSFDYKKVDGIIFSPVIDLDYHQRNTKIIELLKSKGMPLVLMDRYVSGIQSSYITSDDRNSSRILTDKLIRAGHERILISAGLECSSMTERIKGIKQAYMDHGIKFRDEMLIIENDNKLYPELDPGEFEKMKSQIKKVGSFSAFYAQNDRLLTAGIQCLISLGIDINSIQLALHDDISCQFPPYTDNIPKVIPPIYKMGMTTAQVLLDNIIAGDNRISQVILKSEIIFGNLEDS